MFAGLPGGSSSGNEGDPSVFGPVAVVLLWLFVVAVVAAFTGSLFYAAMQIEAIN